MATTSEDGAAMSVDTNSNSEFTASEGPATRAPCHIPTPSIALQDVGYVAPVQQHVQEEPTSAVARGSHARGDDATTAKDGPHMEATNSTSLDHIGTSSRNSLADGLIKLLSDLSQASKSSELRNLKSAVQQPDGDQLQPWTAHINTSSASNHCLSTVERSSDIGRMVSRTVSEDVCDHSFRSTPGDGGRCMQVAPIQAPGTLSDLLSNPQPGLSLRKRARKRPNSVFQASEAPQSGHDHHNSMAHSSVKPPHSGLKHRAPSPGAHCSALVDPPLAHVSATQFPCAQDLRTQPQPLGVPSALLEVRLYCLFNHQQLAWAP